MPYPSCSHVWSQGTLEHFFAVFLLAGSSAFFEVSMETSFPAGRPSHREELGLQKACRGGEACMTWLLISLQGSKCVCDMFLVYSASWGETGRFALHEGRAHISVIRSVGFLKETHFTWLERRCTWLHSSARIYFLREVVILQMPLKTQCFHLFGGSFYTLLGYTAVAIEQR